jgi:hypothetical protein
MSHDIHSNRFNIYITVHKGLRSFMCDTLSRLGRLDVHDADEMSKTLGQVRQLLDACVSHLTHENEFLHVAMDARASHSSRKTAMDHAKHLETISALREKAQALESAPVATRDMLSLELYRKLALFIAENFEHMHFEETVNCGALWANYSDDHVQADAGAVAARGLPRRAVSCSAAHRSRRPDQVDPLPESRPGTGPDEDGLILLTWAMRANVSVRYGT